MKPKIASVVGGLTLACFSACGAAPGAPAPMSSSTPDPVAPPAAPQLRNWAAWLDKMPTGPARQHVKGEVYVPNGATEARLTRAAASGSAPALLRLDLTFVQKPGPATQALTWVESRYDEDPAKADYKQVEIRWQGQVVQRLTVEVVH